MRGHVRWGVRDRSDGAWLDAGLWRRITPGASLAMLLIAFGCSGQSAPGGGAGAPGTGGSGQGGTNQGGSGQGGTDAWPSPDAPLCSTQTDPPVIEVTVSGEFPDALFGIRALERVRVVEQGVGSAGMPLPIGASSADEVGWLRVRVVGAGRGADAGSADAGRIDPGGVDEGASGPERMIMGPRELGELPVIIGDQLVLTHEDYRTSSIGGQHRRTVLEREGRLLLFDQAQNDAQSFGTFSGATLAAGDAVCARPYPNAGAGFCAYIYSHELVVSVPGGATATLMPGQEEDIGGYRALHRDTTSNDPVRRTGPDDACADLGGGSSRLILVLRPDSL
jgi:hypothetical protein